MMKQNHVDGIKSQHISLQKADPATKNEDLNSKQLYYFKYMPYDSMLISEKKHFVDSAQSAKSKERTRAAAATADDAATDGSKTITKWASAQHRPPTSSAYHAAELSLFYREAPGLKPLLAEKTNSSTKNVKKDAKIDDNLTYDEGSSKESSSTFESRQSSRLSSRAAYNSIGAGIRNQQDILAASPSNRLLNVISIDQCHIKHRRAAGRRSQATAVSSKSHNNNIRSTTPCMKQHTSSMGSLLERLTTFESFDADKLPKSQSEFDQGHAEAQFEVMPATSSRPETRRERQQRQTRQGALIAGQRHAKRNQLLRDQMDIYLQWCQVEKCKEREIMAQGGNAAVDSIRRFGKEERLKIFNDLLREQEIAFSKSETPIILTKSRSTHHPHTHAHVFSASNEKINHELSDESNSVKENLLSDMLSMLQ